MSVSTYSPPVSNLLTCGKSRAIWDSINYLQEFGFKEEHTPELIRIATDKELYSSNPETLERWAPVHAWRALAQLCATEAIEPLIDFFNEGETDDDWINGDLLGVFSLIGASAIPALKEYLGNRSNDFVRRINVAGCLVGIAEKHPELKYKCVDILTEQLELFQTQVPRFNGTLVRYLIELGAVNSVSVIEKAFAASKVDVNYAGADWFETQVYLRFKE
ncbi:unknown protein [Calothrix sp. PCC 7716]|nr:unknown protein [Calothrix sp. PCC 7716]